MIEGAPNPAGNESVPVPSEADFEAAQQLVEENELLRNNPRVQMLVENDFVTEEGRQLDPGNFLHSMLAYLESQQADVTQEQLSAAVDRKVEEGIVHSRDPEEELRTENRV